MKKLSILLVIFIAFTACHTATPESTIKASNGSFSAEKEQEDLQEFLKERTRYNAVFKEVQSDLADAWDAMLDIFGDYGIDDVHTYDLLSADLRDSFGFGGFSENDSEYYY